VFTFIDPGKPGFVHTTSSSESVILVEWDQPCPVYGEIVKYDIKYTYTCVLLLDFLLLHNFSHCYNLHSIFIVLDASMVFVFLHDSESKSHLLLSVSVMYDYHTLSGVW
jgi:hypothetical protein